MINLSSGGRLSGVVAGVMILLAALVGVMVVVAQQTFAWGLLCVAGKVAVNDVPVIVVVTAITVTTDLATAVAINKRPFSELPGKTTAWWTGQIR